MVGDAGSAVARAADEAEAVGQQRQAGHRVCVVLEGAQDGGEGDEGAAGWNEMNPAAKAAKAKMDDDEEEGLARAKDDDAHNMDL